MPANSLMVPVEVLRNEAWEELAPRIEPATAATNSPATESVWGTSSLEELPAAYHRSASADFRTHTGRILSAVESEHDHDTFRYMENSRRRERDFASRYIGMGMYYGAQESRIMAAMQLGSWDLDPDGAKATRELVDAPSRDTLVRILAPAVEPDATPRVALAVEAEALLGYKPLRMAVKAPGALRAVLAKLEIEVLDEASVNAYKAQMVQHYDTHKKMSAPTWRLTELSKYTQPVPEFVLRKACDIKRELPTAIFYIDQLAVDPFLLVSITPITDFMTNQARKLDPETQAYVEVWDEPKFEEVL